MISNILGNFEDIDPGEQSMFVNLHIRNKRQKVLHNTSFETEFFDIYDPHFTSQEEETGQGEEGDERVQRGQAEVWRLW